MDEAISLTQDLDIKTCHNLKTKLISKFINTRLHFYCKKVNGELRKTQGKTKMRLDSKSITMRKLVTSIKQFVIHIVTCIDEPSKHLV